MDVIVDNARQSFLEGQSPTLMSLIAAVGESLRKEGRGILSLKIGGREIRPEDVAGLAERPLDGAGEVEVTSQALTALADQSLRELEQVLPELPGACHALAAIFQGSTPAEGFGPFRQLADIWSAVKARELEVAQALDYPLDDIRIGDEPMLRLHEELNRYLEEAAGALESGDCVLLGDLLEYELAPRAQQEAEIVAALRRRVLQPTA